ncbi:tetraacyldisaccharide 4'-kinase [Acidiphilium multivorum]|uniref:tetraacyldisaccharide 4'-kinase n=1 Tax=Acidiphilium multivorum TaxID=62140 RepID=UPI001F4C02A7|nr:tetraacyldisaccharide 4'-kinase [Acidiphilium multivorum]UNC15552.1 tetraacyldisaccharide 4'-kinase [Acidiphilium multivorum]
MRAPAFWTTDAFPAPLLAPLGAITRALTARRVAQPGFRSGARVFCAGNAGVGGAGKTILARHLLARLADRGETVFALTRGHGGRLAGPLRVDPARHGAAEVGDEALLLAATAPTIIARDRAAGAAFAVAAGATAIVMDDGLQNPDPVKTASFLVIDGGAGFGNGRLLPAGPLREPVEAAARRCAAAVLIGADRTGARAALPPSLPVLTARLVTDAGQLAGARILGFAGIGRPEKFFESLRDAGAELAGALPFPDHHAYRPGDLARLDAEAGRLGARLATTAKDAVKLPPAFRARCAVIEAGLAFDDPAALDRFLT